MERGEERKEGEEEDGGGITRPETGEEGRASVGCMSQGEGGGGGAVLRRNEKEGEYKREKNKRRHAGIEEKGER